MADVMTAVEVLEGIKFPCIGPPRAGGSRSRSPGILIYGLSSTSERQQEAFARPRTPG